MRMIKTLNPIELPPRSTDTVLTSTGERLRSKSREERKDSRNSDLRKEHDEMKARNQVCRKREVRRPQNLLPAVS